MKTTNTIKAKINDQLIEISGEKAFMPLGSFLRNEEALNGTKIVCAEGDCGACTVLMDQKAVRSCMLTVEDVAGKKIISIERLSYDGDLHPIPKAFVNTATLQ